MTATLVRCRCGETEIELTAKPIAQFYCHCDDCQAVHGAAYVPESVYPADAVTIIKGSPKSWTLKRNPRFWCGECGTRLFIDVLSLRLRGLNGYLLPEGEFRAAFHVRRQFAVRPVSDDLPHFKSMPARLGGSDETVGW
jgi:hypothetical protein